MKLVSDDIADKICLAVTRTIKVLLTGAKRIDTDVEDTSGHIATITGYWVADNIRIDVKT